MQSNRSSEVANCVQPEIRYADLDWHRLVDRSPSHLGHDDLPAVHDGSNPGCLVQRHTHRTSFRHLDHTRMDRNANPPRRVRPVRVEQASLHRDSRAYRRRSPG